MALDPTDVYPRRNLPNESENWGRALETDVRGTKKAIQSLSSSVKAIARTLSTSLQQLGVQLTTLSEQQVLLSDASTRVAQTNQVISKTYTMDSNTSGWLPQIDVTPPEWARYAMVTASYSKDAASTSREIILPTYALLFTSVSIGGRYGTLANGFFTGDWWEPYEVTSPMVVDTAQTNNTLSITTYKSVMASGTGTIQITVFYSIVWIAG